MTHVVQLDGRGRVSLGRFATSDTYVLDVRPGGQIVLEPAEVITAAERRALADAGLKAQVTASFASNEAPRPHTPRSSTAH
jgi:hypothetical protein